MVRHAVNSDYVDKMCYECGGWRWIEPNYEGIIDVGFCAIKLVDIYEDTKACPFFTKANMFEEIANKEIRKKLLEVYKKVRQRTEEECEERIKEEVVDDILDTIKWSIMRGITN